MFAIFYHGKPDEELVSYVLEAAMSGAYLVVTEMYLFFLCI